MHNDYDVFCLMANAVEGKKKIKPLLAFINNQEKFLHHKGADYGDEKTSTLVHASVDQNVSIKLFMDNQKNCVRAVEALNFDTLEKALFSPDDKGAFHLRTGKIADDFGTLGAGQQSFIRFFETRSARGFPVKLSAKAHI